MAIVLCHSSLYYPIWGLQLALSQLLRISLPLFCLLTLFHQTVGVNVNAVVCIKVSTTTITSQLIVVWWSSSSFVVLKMNIREHMFRRRHYYHQPASHCLIVAAQLQRRHFLFVCSTWAICVRQRGGENNVCDVCAFVCGRLSGRWCR